MINFKKFTIVGADGSPYLTRWFLFKTRLLSIYLHKIWRSDEDDLHDHPWDFTSLILKGGYWEDSVSGLLNIRRLKWFGPLSINRKKAEDLHKVDIRNPTWTLVFVGPKRREWGFRTNEGWVHHKDYLDEKFGKGNWKSVDAYENNSAQI